ncbi:MAG: HAD-IA family hydrolase [Candidatus Omnitrophica bacterium]|nr:HAD-IA family hydrolase [Candidatus Omnitrophota bacterium]
MKKLILYDLDGTLVDTSQDIVLSTQHMLREMGAPLLGPERIIPLVGSGVRKLVAGSLGTDDPARVDKAVAIYRAHYAEHLLDHSRLFPGVKEVLDYFRGRLQAVVTNKPNPYSRRILEGLGVEGYFTEIIGGDSPLPKKPDPAILIDLMQRHRIAPAEALFIGDSPIDIQAGRAAGIRTAIVSQGFSTVEEIRAAAPEILAGNFTELLMMIEESKW